MNLRTSPIKEPARVRVAVTLSIDFSSTDVTDFVKLTSLSKGASISNQLAERILEREEIKSGNPFCALAVVGARYEGLVR